MLAGAILSGCDVGEPDGFEPPALHVIGTLPANGDGVACSGGDSSCGVSLLPEVVVQFDRLLWPEPSAFESLRIYTGSPRNRVPLDSYHYDPLERTLTYQLGAWLAPRALYRVELPGHAQGHGPRAFDGAELEPGSVPLSFGFFTRGAGTSLPLRPERPRTPSCDEIMQVLGAHCGSGACHGGNTPAMGVALDSREAFSTTALRRVARQTDSAGTPGVPQLNPARFGVAMPIVEPGSAAHSYLVYKILITDSGFPECADERCARFENPGETEHCELLPQLERRRLRDWFVRGEPMPHPDAESGPLDCASFRALLRFIDAGAKCD